MTTSVRFFADKWTSTTTCRGSRRLAPLWLVPLGLATLFAAAICGCGGSDSGNGVVGMPVRQTNLVSDEAGNAAMVDPNLVNPWGLAANPTGPLWINDNGQGVSTLYDSSGDPFPVGQPLVVTVPPPAGSPAGAAGAPTGMVFNNTQDFVVTEGMRSAASVFIFSTEDGTVSGWNPNVDGEAAILAVDNSASGAVYKGLALGSNAGGSVLFATDFHNGRIDAFDGTFAPATLSGSFADPHIPAGFAPFGIATIQGNLCVTYAKQDADQEDDVAGPGNGFINVFDTNGSLIRRFASQGVLNSPWAVVLAPPGFGPFGNTILVGNFGDGEISAFDAANGAFLGQLTDGANPLKIDGLWGLIFGNGATAGGVDTLYFTAGPDEEQHGLFGMLQPDTGGM
jgi:uncharacterized protein (TIGR03118 family)